MNDLVAALLLVTELTSLGWTALRLARVLVPAGSTLDRALVASVVAAVDAVAVLQILGAVHLIWAPIVCTTQVAIAMIVALRGIGRPTQSEQRWLPSLSRGSVAAGGIAFIFGLLLVVQALRGPSQEFDTKRYHVVNAAQWMTSHSTWALPFAAPGDNTATAPGNGELIDLWFMLPTADDRLSGLGIILAAAICALAVAVIARALARPAWLGALAAMAVLAAPLSYLYAARSMQTDLDVCAGLVGALAVALLVERNPGSARPLWLLAGLALGLAAGSKLVALPAVGLTIVVLIATAHRDRLAAGIRLISGAAALSAFWYLRNWALGGSPIAPRGISIGGHALFPGSPDAFTAIETPLVSHIVHGHLGQLETWHSTVDLLLGRPLEYIVATLPLIMLLGRRQPRVVAVGALALGQLGLYAITPFTGGGESGEFELIGGVVRFALPGTLLATCVVAAYLPVRVAVPLLSVVLLDDGSRLLNPPFRGDLVLTTPYVLVVLGIAAAAALGLHVAIRAGLPTPVVHRRRGLLGFAGVSLVGATIAVASAGRGEGDGAIQQALGSRGDRAPLVVTLHTSDVRDLLGEHLDAPLVAVGDGPPGRLAAITDPALLTQEIEALHPAAVAVGDDGIADPLPMGWRPPVTWVRYGHQGHCEIYRPA